MPEEDHHLDRLDRLRGRRIKHSELMPEAELDQVGLLHLLGCRTWTEAWSFVRQEVGPDFEEERRQQMWRSAVQI